MCLAGKEKAPVAASGREVGQMGAPSTPCTLLPPNQGPTSAHGRRAPLAWSGGNRARGEVAAGVAGKPSTSPPRWVRPCPPPPCSHPTHPPTVQPLLLGAGPQGNGEQVGACCGRCARRNPLPAATPPPCGDLAARTLPLSPHLCWASKSATGGDGGMRGVGTSCACVHTRRLRSKLTLN